MCLCSTTKISPLGFIDCWGLCGVGSFTQKAETMSEHNMIPDHEVLHDVMICLFPLGRSQRRTTKATYGHRCFAFACWHLASNGITRGIGLLIDVGQVPLFRHHVNF